MAAVRPEVKGVESSGEETMDRQRSTEWLKTIHKNVSDLCIINDLFWQFQGVLTENSRLALSNNIFFDWVNAIFSESIVMRVRREVDTAEDNISTLRLLRRLQANPSVLNGTITEADITTDIEALSRRADAIRQAAPAIIVRGYADRRVAHADPRGLQDGYPMFRHVRECIDQLCGLVNRYGRVACDEDLSILPPVCGTRWQEVFTFPWIDQED
jgi:hypothetical protein